VLSPGARKNVALLDLADRSMESLVGATRLCHWLAQASRISSGQSGQLLPGFFDPNDPFELERQGIVPDDFDDRQVNILARIRSVLGPDSTAHPIVARIPAL
jgi:hypothetical protein